MMGAPKVKQRPKYFVCRRCKKIFSVFTDRCWYCIRCNKSNRHLDYASIKLICEFCNHSQTVRRINKNQTWLCSVCLKLNKIPRVQ